jgi:hypothetical protein
VREACIRGRLLKSDASRFPAICEIAVVADTSDYDFDPAILVIRSAILEGEADKLTTVTSQSMDKLYPGWDNGTAVTGTPTHMVMDLEQKAITLYPTPDEAFTLRLRVWRVPLQSELMEEDDDEPVIDLPDPEELKHWAAYEAYLKKDGETYDPQRSAAHLDQFESRFGKRPTLHDMARWADSPTSVRRAHFF